MCTRLIASTMLLAFTLANAIAAPDALRISRFLPDKPLSRAHRPTPITALLENTGDTPLDVQARLVLPPGVHLVKEQPAPAAHLEDGEQQSLTWQIEADAPGTYLLRLEASAGNATVTLATYPMHFLPALESRTLPYIPEPVPAPTRVLVGAHHCPLWEADKPYMWANVLKHPERTPALGFYSQENPEVADWETKWAVEHGISFFIYCWYRTSQGGAVKTQFGSAIHDALFKSRFAGHMKFTIMWENQARGTAGVADEHDLFSNLLPYWITNYFLHPSYLKIDGQPLLFIYRPEFLVQDLGSVEKVKQAFDRMRQVCREAGFSGLHLLGEYRGLDPNHLQLMRRLGLDYTFAYCWYVPNNPTPAQAIDTQLDYLHKTRDLGILPEVATVSQAWSGWSDEGTIWKIPPADFVTLLRQAKDFIATFPTNQLGSRLLLLDNWNEWGEGHYLAPYREFAFGYLDAVRQVFSPQAGPHLDFLPEDIGMGPYDLPYRQKHQLAETQRKLLSRKTTKPGPPEEGLIAWWAFDEDTTNSVTWDYSGHRLGGVLHHAKRTAGVDGSALVCDGGCVLVENHRLLSPSNALTITCWVRTDLAGQDNKWFVNRVVAGSTAAGYRLGVLEGKPCFEVPLTDWSHHLKGAAPLPTGRWVHLAGTFDGQTLRLYVDGQETASVPRPGPVNPSDARLCLGGYELNHPSHFTGLLDEVKLYRRALSASEVQAQSRLAHLPPPAEPARSL
jgi:hypothetical protein